MKHKLFALVLVLLMISVNMPVLATTPARSNTSLLVNGKSIMLSHPIVFVEGVALLPASASLTDIGIKTDWLKDKGKIQFSQGVNTLVVVINSNQAVFNSKAIQLKAKSKLIGGIAYYPVEAVCEKFGARVLWDVLKNTLQIQDETKMTAVELKKLEMKLNAVGNNGAAWGPNIKKIARFGDMSYTFVYQLESNDKNNPALNGIGRVFMYQKKDGEDWKEGINFLASAPPNVIVDKEGIVRIVFLEPIEGFDRYSCKLTHIKFDLANTVQGPYLKEYLTNGNIATGAVSLDNYASIYMGASIAMDNTILVAYNNSLNSDAIDGGQSIGVQILNPTTGKWTYETLRDNMASRYCYPITSVSKDYYHVLVIEDQYDPLLEAAVNLSYRFGAVKHFQRKISGGPWEETTLIDFNQKPGISLKQLNDSTLRITDLTVDENNKVHALIKYSGYFDGQSIRVSGNSHVYDFQKNENSSNWTSQAISNGDHVEWSSLWKAPDNKLHYVFTNSEGVFIMPYGTSEKFIVLKNTIANINMLDFGSFISGQNNTTDKSNCLDMVLLPINGSDVVVRTISLKYENGSFKLPYLTDIVQLEGELFYSTGKAASLDTYVDVYSATNVLLNSIPVDSYGRFTINGLNDGTYKLLPNYTRVNGENILSSIMKARYTTDAITIQVKNRIAATVPQIFKLKAPQATILVSDAAGGALPNWQFGVFVSRKGYPIWSEHLLNGDAQLLGLADGTYSVQIRPWDESKSQFLPSSSITLTIRSGKVVGESNVKMIVKKK